MSGSEVVFLLLIGLVVLGPEKLPDAIRRVGRLYAELKRMSSGVQSEIRQVMDEPIKEFMKTKNTAKSLFTGAAAELHAASKELVEPTFVPYAANATPISVAPAPVGSTDDSLVSTPSVVAPVELLPSDQALDDVT